MKMLPNMYSLISANLMVEELYLLTIVFYIQVIKVNFKDYDVSACFLP